MADRRLGFLGGGNMAEALLRGLLQAGAVEPAAVRVGDKDAGRRSELADRYHVVTEADNVQVASWATQLVIAVKPQVLPSVLGECGGSVAAEALVVSVVAGATTASIEAKLAARVVRAMPNTPALVLAGATALCPGSRATAQDVETARALFDSVGQTVVLDETLMDAVTGLSGSGPAYVMMIIDALADGGVKMGLPRAVALQLAAQTVYGSAKLVLDRDEHPARLKDMVTSPGGTTIYGVDALEKAGLRRALIRAVEAATRRSMELGRG